MRTLIRGSWVVAWSGTSHELIRDGVCVVDGHRVVEVGTGYTGPYDRELGGPGCLVSPGLISTHLHASVNAADYVFLDRHRPDAAGRNYLNWQAGVAGRPRTRPDAAIGLRFGLGQCLKSGVTTVVEVGAGGDPGAMLQAVTETGIRAYTGLSYRNETMWSEWDGSLRYQWNDASVAFENAVAFAEDCIRDPSGRISPILCPGHPDTCDLDLLEATSELAAERGWPVTIHAGLHVQELERTFTKHRCSPFELLDRAGLLGPRTLLGHAIMHRRHSWSPYAGDDLALLADRRAVISHSPVKYLNLGILLESLQRYHDAGITITIGTDFAPSDIIAEMRAAMTASRVADRSFLSGTPRLVFDAATVNAADALGRPDLGRLAPGAKADVAVFDLGSLRYGAVHDPIRALVEYGSAGDVRCALVDGTPVVHDGRLANLDEEELLAAAVGESERLWRDVPNWYPRDRAIDDIVEPAYPIR